MPDRIVRPEWVYCPSCGATRPRRPGTGCCRACGEMVFPVLGRLYRLEREEDGAA